MQNYEYVLIWKKVCLHMKGPYISYAKKCLPQLKQI